MGSPCDVKSSYLSQQILGTANNNSAFDSCLVFSINMFLDAVDFIYEYTEIINKICVYLILLIKTRT
jgi:hypothetical protein